MADKPTSSPASKPDVPIDLATSVAGEEDPGASLDLPVSSGQPVVPPAKPRPGEQAPEGKPSIGKD